MEISIRNLNYLISENRNIALYCTNCKLYYIIDSKDYQNLGPNICDKCYLKFVDELYYLYNNSKPKVVIKTKNRKRYPKLRKKSFFYNIKKLIERLI